MNHSRCQSPGPSHLFFNQIRLSPPKITPRKYKKKNSFDPFKVESRDNSSRSFETQKMALKKPGNNLDLVSDFSLGNLGQMCQDFYEEEGPLLFSAGSSKQVQFKTPEKPLEKEQESDLKIVYGKSGPDRTNVTPDSPRITGFFGLNKKDETSGAIGSSSSSCEVLRLKIPASYCFESQLSEISEFKLKKPLEPKERPSMSPSLPTVNQNVVSTTPLCFDFNVNLNEVDAISFDATGHVSQVILNPNDITGTQKPLFPYKKSGKKLDMFDSEMKSTFLCRGKSSFRDRTSVRNCSNFCACESHSQFKQSGGFGSQLKLSNPFVSGKRRSRYISNRMKFEKLGERKRIKRKGCKCQSQKDQAWAPKNKILDVSEFKIPEPKSGVPRLKFSYLDFEKLNVQKEDFFHISPGQSRFP